MKTRLLPLLLATAALSACSTPSPPPPETAFIRDFSLGQAVATISAPQLHGRTGGNGFSASHDKDSQYRRYFELVYDLREASCGPFDEAAFIAAVREEVEKAASAGGVRITSRGTSTETIDLRYETPEGHAGLVYVFGKRVRGGEYMLRGEILESIGAGRRI